MIIDSLENLGNYAALCPLLPIAIDFIKTHDLNSLPEGKTQIQGDDVFVNVIVMQGKTPDAAKLETHDVMLDIQIPLNAVEVMGYTPRADLKDGQYNAETDVAFYDGMASQYVAVKPGMFTIFLPEDGHAPGISDEQQLRKMIFKVKVTK